MKAILAVNNLGFIGLKDKNGGAGLPWRCKADFSFFKNKTKPKDDQEPTTLLVGYNTFLTLPPLKGRKIVVAERNDIDLSVIDWCIGGKATYERYAPMFTELHISHIDDNTIGDTTFPDLRFLNPNCMIYNYYFKENKILTLEELNIE